MNILYIISIIFIIVGLSSYISSLIIKHQIKKKQENTYEYLSQKQQINLNSEYNQKSFEIDQILLNKRKEFQKEIEKITHDRNVQIEALNLTRQLAQTEKESREQAIIDAKQLVDNQINEYKTNKIKLIEKEIEQNKLNLENKFNAVLLEYTELQNKRREEIDKETQEIQNQLNEYKAKLNAVNEQIRKEEELANTIEVHSIHLAAAAKEDIKFLLSIEPNINNKEILRKLIWTTYIQPEFNLMIKKQFGSNIPKNVIYCIENINTHKKYIGKTQTEISKRWTEHIKASLNIGTISHQAIHDALYGHWDEFTFSIMEIVEKDNLNDREKYYIKFYETDSYGYNMKRG